MVFKIICILVLRTKVASALEGLIGKITQKQNSMGPRGHCSHERVKDSTALVAQTMKECGNKGVTVGENIRNLTHSHSEFL